MKTCENCGERIYNLGCVNCNEMAYIEEQDYITERDYVRMRWTTPGAGPNDSLRVHPMNVDLSKAHDGIIAGNHARDPSYNPYCGRCSGLVRMKLVEPFLWKHSCGAVHDERQVIVANPSAER